MITSALVVLAVTSACVPDGTPPPPLRSSALSRHRPPGPSASSLSTGSSSSSSYGQGRIGARPAPSPRLRHTPTAATSGRLALHLGGARDGFVYVPPGVSHGEPIPLVVFFHGAGADAGQAEMLRAFADEHHALLLAIDSRGSTWDVVGDEIGPDVAFLDRSLAWTFERFTVDPSRIALSGFSDGASYALSLGLANGDLFQYVIAFSPGFSAAPELHGKPRVFVAHGIGDRVLPIGRCCRRLVPELELVGYDVTYREFDGPHAVPAAVASEAMHWFAGRPNAKTQARTAVAP